ESYDAITVCSQEDRSLIGHSNVNCVPNGSSIELGGYRPSVSSQLIFMGPFRYSPNLHGILHFLRDAFPRIKGAIPDATLAVLGGDLAREIACDDPAFSQPGVLVYDHRDDIAGFLQESALTVNPQCDIRGSSIKVIESLSAG